MDHVSEPSSQQIGNAEIADALARVGDLLELQNANPFRIRAYRNAARVIQGLPQDVRTMLDEGSDLTELPGIGDDLAHTITELTRTGRLRLLRRLESETPASLVDLLALPGLGPARVRLLQRQLHVKSIDDLRRAIKTGEISKIAGFGAKTIARIAEALERPRAGGGNGRLPWVDADKIAQALIAYLRKLKEAAQVEIAGSYRRQAETVGDLDVLISAARPESVIDHFVKYPEVAAVTAQGETRAAAVLRSGFQVDLRVVPASSYGAALLYFTGSKPHNLALRTRAISRHLKLNEYGLFRDGRRIAGRTEAEIYKALRLKPIPPELRENRGEVEASAEDKLPDLIARGDLKGDLHVHTAATDGTATIVQMVEAARKAKLSYIAIADHTRSLRVAHGLDVKRRRKQMAEIDEINATLSDITVLKAAEVDILPDGTLDLSDEILAELDLVLCAIHSSFDLSAAKQTDRILRAMDHPACAILAHPTGRLIGGRPALTFDMERVLRRAKEIGVAMELNAQPQRLDLSDIHCRQAREMGVKLVISSDAHSPLQFGFLDRGIAQARRGWLEAKDVLNTRAWPDAKRMLRRH